MSSCIYVIENSVYPGRVYIGSATLFSKRTANHFKRLAQGTHVNAKLQHSYNKHGKHVFSIRPLIYCSPENLLFYEQRAIDSYDAVSNGYNINPTAGSNLGRKWSDEVRKKMSITRTGKPIVQPFGKKASEKHKANISKALKGKIKSAEHCKNLSVAKRGTKASEETRMAMSLRRIGTKQSAETIAKRNATLKAMRAKGIIRVNSQRSADGKWAKLFSAPMTTTTTSQSSESKVTVTK